MADAIRLDVVTPAGILLSEEVSYVQAPGGMGLFGIMKNHAPLMTSLEVGGLKYTKDGRDFYLAVSGGFLEVKDNQVIVLANAAEHAADIDVARAKAAEDRARTRLSKREAGLDVMRAEMALARALNRQKISSKM